MSLHRRLERSATMNFIRHVLRVPHTIAASLLLVTLLGIGAAWRMPVDIFPEINIPVVSVVWTYNGMSATDMRNRILSLHERQMASLVDDISRIEATAYQESESRESICTRAPM